MRIAAPVEPLPGSSAACTLDRQEREKPTLPHSNGQESLINPFSRIRRVPVAAVVRRFDAPGLDDDTSVFAALRQ